MYVHAHVQWNLSNQDLHNNYYKENLYIQDTYFDPILISTLVYCLIPIIRKPL